MDVNQPDEIQMRAYQRFVIEGRTKAEVAKELNICERTVYVWSKNVATWFKESIRDEIAGMRAKLTLRHEHIYSLAMRGFDDSKRDKVVTTVVNDETKVQTTPQAGQPAFLASASNALEHLEKLWSAEMDATEKRTDVRCVGKTREQMLSDQIKKLEEMRKRAIALSGGGSGDRA